MAVSPGRPEPHRLVEALDEDQQAKLLEHPLTGILATASVLAEHLRMMHGRFPLVLPVPEEAQAAMRELDGLSVEDCEQMLETMCAAMSEMLALPDGLDASDVLPVACAASLLMFESAALASGRL